MIKACIVVPDAYREDRLFDLSDLKLNRDNCLFPFYLLRKTLAAKGIELTTQDINLPDESEIILYHDMPRGGYISNTKAKNILLLFETEVIYPDNWYLHLHNYFDIIFTWDDRFADHGKYVKFYFPNYIPEDFESFARRPRDKLCTMVAGNKSSPHPLELYSERVKAIEWFEQQHLDDFDLYGIGWDRKIFSGILKPLNRIQLAGKILTKPHPSYRGSVLSKIETLSKYKFAICYENARDIPGYITEKIFDCIVAGTVPIYLGAPNISDYIPSTCFINKANFLNYQDLFFYLSSMKENERRNFVEAGIEFIKSSLMHPFSAEYFANHITEVVC